MQLTDQQQQALNQIERFVDSDLSIFILKGYAGTGKTTLLTFITAMLERKQLPFQLMAPTGRATKVIRSKTDLPAHTIHKSIYDFEDLVETGNGEGFRLLFPVKVNTGNHSICIVDECSMVSAMKSKHEIYDFGTNVLMDDLLTYASPHAGGKIIFIGDPAQLPPVSDADSRAFDESFFQQIGLQTMSCELTQVLRQGDNAILRNATLCRNILKSKQFCQLCFEQKANEVELMNNISVEFCKRYDIHQLSDSVVITFSNKRASRYNHDIRNLLFPGRNHVAQDDLLMCVTNNYSYGHEVYNGDFLKVLSADESVITRHATITVEKAGKKERQQVELRFRLVVLQLDDGEIIDCYLLDSFLESENPNLTIEEFKALYIDFRTRHPHLKPNTEEFRKALRADRFYNALHVKYGYAITGHKSQGGEWNTVFVDYAGQYGNTVNSLRWIYTVTSRAKKLLCSPNFPQHSTFGKFRMDEITKVTQLPDDFYPKTSNQEDSLKPTLATSPFHPESSPDFLKEKYFELSQAMTGTPFSIVGIVSCNYLEKYTIATPSGHFQFLGDYRKNHQFKFRSQPLCRENEAVLDILNGQSKQAEVHNHTSLRYEPSTQSMKALYDKVKTMCEQAALQIVNIAEYSSSYYVRYSFQGRHSQSYIDFFNNSGGYLTYANPASLLGDQDAELQYFINLFNETYDQN